MLSDDRLESPRKRLKTENVSVDSSSTSTSSSNSSSSELQALKEVEVGITEFVSPENDGFSGVFKKRYTDFLVNEILLSGEVLHLRSLGAPSDAKTSTAEPTAALREDDSIMDKVKDSEEAGSEKFEMSVEDKAFLEDCFGADQVHEMCKLHDRVVLSTAAASSKARPAQLGKVVLTPITDKDLRTRIHQTIRRVFRSRLESVADNDGCMTVLASAKKARDGGGGGGGGGRDAAGSGRKPPRWNWEERGGQYLHFTLYKENKDTMETLSFIGRQLKLSAKHFLFAGTKDRRGVTVQRVCAVRVDDRRLAGLNPILHSAKLGDFEYSQHKINLGDLSGNEFVITLRDCEFPGVDLAAGSRDEALARATEIVRSSLRNLRERGYFNYYGLQRFGTFATRTDVIGVKMLQGDFKGACEAILHFSPHVLGGSGSGSNGEAAAAAAAAAPQLISSDDKARAEAINLFNTGGSVKESLDKMPRKFSAEATLIRHLGRSRQDYVGALQAIPRNLRLMYVHAYQSLVWNCAAGERWRLFGSRVVEGDLVLINEHRDKQPRADDDDDDDSGNGSGSRTGDGPAHAVDEDGEIIVRATADADNSHRVIDSDSGGPFSRARALTAEEAASGQYSIFDVVLPLPGFDVEYPANAMKQFYQRFMAGDRGGGLDPFDMRRKWKDISLSGSYRKLLSRMGAEYTFDVRLYTHDEQQFVRTDLDLAGDGTRDRDSTAAGTRADTDSRRAKLAVVLKFQLGSSQYATMALRELMKGRAQSYVPDFGGR